MKNSLSLGNAWHFRNIQGFDHREGEYYMYLPRTIGFLFAAIILLLHIWGGLFLGHDLFYPQFLVRGLFVSFIGGIAGYGLGSNIMMQYFTILEKQLALNVEDVEPGREEMRELDVNQSNFTQTAGTGNSAGNLGR